MQIITKRNRKGLCTITVEGTHDPVEAKDAAKIEYPIIFGDDKVKTTKLRRKDGTPAVRFTEIPEA